MSKYQERAEAAQSQAAQEAQGAPFEHNGCWFVMATTSAEREDYEDEGTLGPFESEEKAREYARTVDQFTRAAQILEERGHESSCRARYSGRAMYGAEVPAIVSEAPAMLVAWAVLIAMCEDVEDDEDALTLEDINPRDLPYRSDNMGRTAMVYY